MDRSIRLVAWNYSERKRVFRLHLDRLISEADARGLLMNGDERNVDIFVWCEGRAEIATAIELKQYGTSRLLDNHCAFTARDVRLFRTAASTDKRPGRILQRFASAVLSKSTYQRYVEPHLADMCYEYFAALRHADRRAARRIVIRGYLHGLQPIVAAIVRTIWLLLCRSGR